MAARDAVVVAAAHGSWFDGWSAVWGVLLAAPDLGLGVTWSRIAAVGVVVWLLTWSREFEDPGRRSTAVIPGGRRAPAAAALAVAAVLGAGPLVAAAAWLVLGIPAAGRGARPGALLSAARLGIGALAAWMSVGGGSELGSRGPGSALPDLAFAWLGAHGASIAILLACALAVGWPNETGHRIGSRLGRTTAFVMLGFALAAANRPAGLWLAALCAAAVWPRHDPPSPEARPGWQRAALPVALAAVCAVDLLLG